MKPILTSTAADSYGMIRLSANATNAPTQNPVSRISSTARRTAVRAALEPAGVESNRQHWPQLAAGVHHLNQKSGADAEHGMHL